MKMWSLLPTRTQIAIVAASGIVVAWALDAVYGVVTGQSAGPLKWLSLSLFIVGTVLVTVASAAWRPIWQKFPLLQRRTFPDLTGTWDGTLLSTWEDPITKQRNAPVSTTVTIVQSLFSTSVKLRTAESVSYSTRCLLEPYVDEGRFRIWYSYRNEPLARFREGSSPHEGVAWLELDYECASDRLVGMYYTSRKTTGDIDLRRAHLQESP